MFRPTASFLAAGPRWGGPQPGSSTVALVCHLARTERGRSGRPGGCVWSDAETYVSRHTAGEGGGQSSVSRPPEFWSPAARPPGARQRLCSARSRESGAAKAGCGVWVCGDGLPPAILTSSARSLARNRPSGDHERPPETAIKPCGDRHVSGGTRALLPPNSLGFRESSGGSFTDAGIPGLQPVTWRTR
jgi:hypothetical protein